MAIMFVWEGLEFEIIIESDFCNLNYVVRVLFDVFGFDIYLLCDFIWGGVVMVFMEIVWDIGLGVNL